MTEELIVTIAEAEAKATQKKVEAEAQASRILAEAETEANRVGQTLAQESKAYAEEQIKTAKIEAQNRYDETLEKQRKSAKVYCAKALENADDAIARIVGRIVNGNR